MWLRRLGLHWAVVRFLSEVESRQMNPEHSKHCHCVCTDLFDLQAAIEEARAIHYRKEPRDVNCLVCGTTTENCDNCKYLKDCIVCGEEWPCDTYIALDYQA
jgi:hypothetical protein